MGYYSLRKACKWWKSSVVGRENFFFKKWVASSLGWETLFWIMSQVRDMWSQQIFQDDNWQFNLGIKVWKSNTERLLEICSRGKKMFKFLVLYNKQGFRSILIYLQFFGSEIGGYWDLSPYLFFTYTSLLNPQRRNFLRTSSANDRNAYARGPTSFGWINFDRTLRKWRKFS